jgi:hypothetical protein
MPMRPFFICLAVFTAFQMPHAVWPQTCYKPSLLSNCISVLASMPAPGVGDRHSGRHCGSKKRTHPGSEIAACANTGVANISDGMAAALRILNLVIAFFASVNRFDAKFFGILAFLNT